jgi:hypothetical protein
MDTLSGAFACHGDQMILGVTGTRTNVMKVQVRGLWAEYKAAGEFRLIHGGAIGGDEIADSVARLYNLLSVDIYPCEPKRYEYWQRKIKDDITTIHEVRLPLVRNRIIARDCDRLLALPREMQETLRSGTWATVRYARQNKKPITILFPDGSVRRE